MFNTVLSRGAGSLLDPGAASYKGQQQAERTNNQIRDLERRVDNLALLNLALWTLLQERTGITEEELEARVQELDLRDGKLDGKIEMAPVECPNCQRPLSRRHLRCMYCDFQLPMDNFEKATI